MPIIGFCNTMRSSNAAAASTSRARDPGSLGPDEQRALSIEFEQSADRTMRGRAPADSPTVSVSGIDHINITVSDLRRSVRFYARVFGFRIIEDGHHEPEPFVIMTAGGHAYLAIRERRDVGSGSSLQPNHWGFVVGDLDSVRQHIWDLGVSVSDDSGAPDQIYEWSNSRSLYVADPDGHTIELVETWGGGLSLP